MSCIKLQRLTLVITKRAPVRARQGGRVALHLARQARWQKLCDQRSPEGQGLLRKEGPPTYAILSQRLVLSQFARFLKCFHRAFNKSHPALGKLKTKVSLLLYGFQQKSACFSLIVKKQNCCRKIRKYALYESS